MSHGAPVGRRSSRRQRSVARHGRTGRLRLLVLGFLARLLYGVVKRTIRPVIGPDAKELLDAFAQGERVIIAFWHGRLAMMQAPYRGRAKGICIQVSQHSDGEIITRAVEPHGIRTARGSASRGVVGSLRAMLEAFAEGYDLAVAVDGPRGPIHEVKRGAVTLAMGTGARVFPVAAAPRRALVFSSWDRFTVPMPFTRVFYVAGEPLRVDRDADEATIEAARLHLEGELERVGEEAELRARGQGDRTLLGRL